MSELSSYGSFLPAAVSSKSRFRVKQQVSRPFREAENDRLLRGMLCSSGSFATYLATARGGESL